MKRLLIIAGVAILGFVLVGWIALTVFVRDLTNPDNLVARIEASLNCRAEIKEASLNLRERPMRMQLSGIALGERDEFAKPSVKLVDRPELQAAVSIDTIFVELEPSQLFNKRLVVRNFVIERPSVKIRVYEDGNTSLDDLFRPPPGALEKTTPTDPAQGSGPKQPKRFMADQLPGAALADRVAIEDATIYATIDKTKYTVQMSQAILQFINIDIDPANLAEHNSANVELGLNVSVDSLRHNKRFLEIAMDGNGSIQPFDPVTRELSPSVTASVTVLRDSFIDAMPMLDEIEDFMEQLENYGVSLEGVRLRGDFSEDTSAEFNVNREKVTITSDFLIPIDENFLIIRGGSWVHYGQNDHEFKVTFIASQRLTERAQSEAEKYLREKLGETQSKVMIKMIMDPLMEGDFLVLNFGSRGDLGDPEVFAENPLGEDLTAILDGSSDDIANEMKEKLESVLKDLIDETSEGDTPEESPQPETSEESPDTEASDSETAEEPAPETEEVPAES